jgi:hypothetical protein
MTPTATATTAAPAAATPYVFNPFDPNAWSQIWQLPYTMAPAAPAAAPAPAPK